MLHHSALYLVSQGMAYLFIIINKFNQRTELSTIVFINCTRPAGMQCKVGDGRLSPAIRGNVIKQNCKKWLWKLPNSIKALSALLWKLHLSVLQFRAQPLLPLEGEADGAGPAPDGFEGSPESGNGRWLFPPNPGNASVAQFAPLFLKPLANIKELISCYCFSRSHFCKPKYTQITLLLTRKNV